MGSARAEESARRVRPSIGGTGIGLAVLILGALAAVLSADLDDGWTTWIILAAIVCGFLWSAYKDLWVARREENAELERQRRRASALKIGSIRLDRRAAVFVYNVSGHDISDVVISVRLPGDARGPAEHAPELDLRSEPSPDVVRDLINNVGGDYRFTMAALRASPHENRGSGPELGSYELSDGGPTEVRVAAEWSDSDGLRREAGATLDLGQPFIISPLHPLGEDGDRADQDP